MSTVIKEGQGKEEHYFHFAALNVVLDIAGMRGWNNTGEDRRFVDRENSMRLFITLRGALNQIMESLPVKQKEGLLRAFTGYDFLWMHIAELILEFLEFTDGEPFRINFKN